MFSADKLCFIEIDIIFTTLPRIIIYYNKCIGYFVLNISARAEKAQNAPYICQTLNVLLCYQETAPMSPDIPRSCRLLFVL